VERLLAGVASHSFATGTIFSAGDRGTIDGTYDLMSRGACAWRAGNGMPAVGHSAPHPIAIAPATACLFRREVLEQLGGFDETFGSYLEDVDLGLRCLREGFTGIYVPDALAWHHGSATWGRWNPRVVRAISRNQVLLVARHYDQALLRSCFWPIVAGQLLWGLLALRHGAAFAWVQGKWEGLRQFHPQGCDSPRLRDFLTASEREIRDRAQGPYWRWYFRLTFFEKTAAH
jgi:GT2 family glycosyltransferase